MDVKNTLRDVKTGTKEAAREVDGHQLKDDVGNAGDRIRDGLGKFGDKVRDEADEADRNAHETGRQDDQRTPLNPLAKRRAAGLRVGRQRMVRQDDGPPDRTIA